MGWLLIIALAAIAAALLWKLGRLPRTAMELSGAALMLGIAGYAWQGNPALPGSPVIAAEDSPEPLAEEAAIRKEVSSGAMSAENQWLDLADVLIKSGRTRQAVSILQGGLTKSPNNPDLWVGLGNALIAHGGGHMSAASRFAFEKAAQISPNHPGPPFFLGLAMVQSGKMDEAGEIWRGLLSRAPEGAPWKADLVARLSEIGQLPSKATK